VVVFDDDIDVAVVAGWCGGVDGWRGDERAREEILLVMMLLVVVLVVEGGL
jgi:hypothetical protein